MNNLPVAFLSMRELIEKYGHYVLKHGLDHIQSRIVLDEVENEIVEKMTAEAYNTIYEAGYKDGLADAKE